jgi:hypothetical protein
MNSLPLNAAVLLLMAVATPAFAQGLLRGDGPMKTLDADGDGSVGLAEAEASWKNQFSVLDADGDGSVSQAEFMDLRRKAFARADGNGDGKLARGELRDMLKQARE